VVREAGGARGGIVQAVSGVSFDILPGETLGIVGETGSGKSTLARAVLQAPRPKSGSVVFRDMELTKLRGSALMSARRNMQFVWQDPFGSLDPKWQVRSIIEEPLVAHSVGSKDARRKRVDELLDLVGLDPARYGKRHPRELSGGQAQRVAVGRALVTRPRVLFADEPTGSLDSLAGEKVMDLLVDAARAEQTAVVLVTHDARVAAHADRQIIVRDGGIVDPRAAQVTV
jgi:oligopeptide transport system ATP-binding protein